jgi:hypothetical protein
LKLVRQTLDDIIGSLSPLEADWKDARAEGIVSLLEKFPVKDTYGSAEIERLLRLDFKAGRELVRLFLDLPKDEFEQRLKSALCGKAIGVKQFESDPAGYLGALEKLGLCAAIRSAVHAPVTWRSVLVERLKSGRGSAIRGQRRGRMLEDFAERIVERVFGERGFDLRCRFRGATGLSTEKADIAILSKEDPRILLESKAYGSTGSKQTDILGDMTRIIAEKRPDTALLLVTDGVAWEARRNDLRKLVEMQNQGRITRIYTTRMAGDLEEDLKTLRVEYGL